jgi:RNA polymerase sigma-70 factor (ECF subfamily)
MSDDLLIRAQSGDRMAITAIVQEHQRAVRSYVARLAPDAATADDLAQEVFLEAFQVLQRIDPQRDLRNYLLGIARNRARMAWRKQYARREVDGEVLFDLLESRASAYVSTSGQSDHRLDHLRACFSRLGPKALEVFQLHYHDELRCDEVAERLKMSAGFIRSILTRGREALRSCIEARAGGAGALTP